jgi:hypothetical protein
VFRELLSLLLCLFCVERKSDRLSGPVTLSRSVPARRRFRILLLLVLLASLPVLRLLRMPGGLGTLHLGLSSYRSKRRAETLKTSSPPHSAANQASSIASSASAAVTSALASATSTGAASHLTVVGTSGGLLAGMLALIVAL